MTRPETLLLVKFLYAKPGADPDGNRASMTRWEVYRWRAIFKKQSFIKPTCNKAPGIFCRLKKMHGVCNFFQLYEAASPRGAVEVLNIAYSF
jgi:hypothetical protein